MVKGWELQLLFKCLSLRRSRKCYTILILITGSAHTVTKRLGSLASAFSSEGDLRGQISIRTMIEAFIQPHETKCCYQIRGVNLNSMDWVWQDQPVRFSRVECRSSPSRSTQSGYRIILSKNSGLISLLGLFHQYRIFSFWRPSNWLASKLRITWAVSARADGYYPFLLLSVTDKLVKDGLLLFKLDRLSGIFGTCFVPWSHSATQSSVIQSIIIKIFTERYIRSTPVIGLNYVARRQRHDWGPLDLLCLLCLFMFQKTLSIRMTHLSSTSTSLFPSCHNVRPKSLNLIGSGTSKAAKVIYCRCSSW